MTAEYNIDVIIGDSWPPGPGAEFVATISSGPVGGPYVAVNLDSATVTAPLKHKDAAAPGVLAIDVKDQGAAPGKVGIRLNASESAKLSNLSYHWALNVDFGADSVLTPLKGLLKAAKP